METEIPLPNIYVQNVRTNQNTKLWELWNEKKIVLCFLRHLGCRFCQQRLRQLNTIKKKLDKCDPPVGLVAISMGTVDQGKELLKVTNFDGELFVDTSSNGNPKEAHPQAVSYNRFSLKRGKDFIFNERTSAAAPAALNEGNTDRPMGSKEGSWPGDPLQVGGIFVLGAGNHCDFSFRSQYAGDHVDLGNIMEAVTGKTAQGLDYIFPSTEKWFERLQISKRFEPLTKLSVSPMKSNVENVVSTIRNNIFYVYLFGSFGVIISSFMSLNHFTTAGSAFDSYLYVSFIILFLGLIFYVLNNRDGNDTSNTKNNLFNIDNVDIITTKEIDLRIVDNGFAECECGSVINNISVEGKFELDNNINTNDEEAEECNRTVSSSSAKLDGDIIADNILIKRQRTQTWDNSLGLNEYQVMLCYVRNFLAKAHPSVGRKGPVCPFVPQSLRRNTLYMGIIRTGDNTTKEQIISCVSQYANKFEELEPKEGRLRKFKAIILIFPDVKESQTDELIDKVQLSCKSSFVKKGLMLGEFHNRNNSPGLRNKNFYPLRTPLPCLAIRHMVPTDIAFLDVDSYELNLRIAFLQSFLKVFGEEKHKEVETARNALNKILEKGN